MRQVDVTFVLCVCVCVCVEGGGGLENNFVRQFTSLNTIKHETLMIDEYG